MLDNPPLLFPSWEGIGVDYSFIIFFNTLYSPSGSETTPLLIALFRIIVVSYKNRAGSCYVARATTAKQVAAERFT